MGFQDIEESRVYQRAEGLADRVWEIVTGWSDAFAKDTIGKQLTRATDSIGANIAESSGRYYPADVIRFLYYARGSLYETRFWIKRARKRGLLPDDTFSFLKSELQQTAKELNAYITFQKTRTLKQTKPPNTITTTEPTNKQTTKPTNKPPNQQTNETPS